MGIVQSVLHLSRSGGNRGRSVRHGSADVQFDFVPRDSRSGRHGYRRSREDEPIVGWRTRKRFGKRDYDFRHPVVTYGLDHRSDGVSRDRSGGFGRERVSGGVGEGHVGKLYGRRGVRIGDGSFDEVHGKSGSARSVGRNRISGYGRRDAGNVSVEAFAEPEYDGIDLSVTIRVPGFSRDDFRRDGIRDGRGADGSEEVSARIRERAWHIRVGIRFRSIGLGGIGRRETVRPG